MRASMEISGEMYLGRLFKETLEWTGHRSLPRSRRCGGIADRWVDWDGGRHRDVGLRQWPRCRPRKDTNWRGKPKRSSEPD